MRESVKLPGLHPTFVEQFEVGFNFEAFSPSIVIQPFSTDVDRTAAIKDVRTVKLFTYSY